MQQPAAAAAKHAPLLGRTLRELTAAGPTLARGGVRRRGRAEPAPAAAPPPRLLRRPRCSRKGEVLFLEAFVQLCMQMRSHNIYCLCYYGSWLKKVEIMLL